jgi:subtilase family serine protease
MGTHSPRAICVFVILFFGFSIPATAQQVAPQPLITQPINEAQVTTLKGNTHPLARPQFDIGGAPPNLPMNRMLLVLKRSPQQDFSLHKLLDDQQDKASPNYHKWLTPDEFGVQFGPSDQDLQLVTGWLQTQGFQVNRVSHGRTVIEFSGTEAQVEQALHTQIHKYLVNGEEHWANSSDPQIPSALLPAVAGVLSLHNFPRKSMSEILGTYSPKTRQLSRAHPQFTLPGFGCYPTGTCYAVGPADFGTIYNAQSLWSSGIDGTGQTIAIVGESDINIQDVRDFRSLFGLPAKDPNIIYDGPNPGHQPDEVEADIDVQWSGAIAPNATIDFVVSQSTETTAGVDLSAIYIIDNNLAPVMSESYGLCELGLGTSGNQFYNSLWAQAASQGITAILASGDSGSAGCDFGSGPAQFGLAVSGFASTPFNVAVGGTDFNDFQNPQQYWNSSNTSPTQESAKGYIPETTWNDSCSNSILLGALGWGTNAENNCNNSQLAGGLLTIGGSGGVSACTLSNSQNPSSCSGGYVKPSWQVAPGVPADGKRDIPDISLFASNGILSSFYIYCQSNSSANCSFGQYGAAGGTSFGAPAFAGIMALVNQQMQTPQGQGNANYVLYKLAGQQSASSCNSSNGSGSSCVFNDITSGTIAMPCFAGSPNCTVKTAGHQYGILSGFSTGTGYDLATGLGSINVANLVNKWNSVVFRPSVTSLSLTTPTNLTHGQLVTVNANVAPASGSGTPTGDVSLLTSTGVAIDGFTLGNGAVSTTTGLLPGGSYTVSAHYAGDSTFGGSTSGPVSVTVGKENSSPQIQLVTFNWQGSLISSNASTAVYGSPYLLRVNVLNSSGAACQPNPLGQAACPTGNLALTDNGSPLDAGTYALNSFGYAEDQIVQFPGGSNSVKAQYAGDNSFNASSATTVMNITPAPTTVGPVYWNPGSVAAQLQAQVYVDAQSFGAAPTGTFTFYANGTAIPGSVTLYPYPRPPNVSLSAAFFSSSSPFPIPGTYALTAVYSGDANYQGLSFPPSTFTIKFPQSTVYMQSSSYSVSPGSSITLSATVIGYSKSIAPTGTIAFSSSQGPISVPVSYSTVTDSNTGDLDLQATISVTPAFTDSYAAQYSGDSNFTQGQGNTQNIVVNGNDFTLTMQRSSVTLAQGQYTQIPMLIGMQASTAPVTFSATPCAGLPSESTCGANLNPVNFTYSDLLNISTTAPHAALTHQSRHGNLNPFYFSLGMPFAAIVLIGARRRHLWRNLPVTLAIGVLLLGLGCGGGSTISPPPPPPSDSGTPKGNYNITVTATSGSGSNVITHTTTFALIVQ